MGFHRFVTIPCDTKEKLIEAMARNEDDAAQEQQLVEVKKSLAEVPISTAKMMMVMMNH